MSDALYDESAHDCFIVEGNGDTVFPDSDTSKIDCSNTDSDYLTTEPDCVITESYCANTEPDCAIIDSGTEIWPDHRKPYKYKTSM